MKPIPPSALPQHCGAANSPVLWRQLSRSLRRTALNTYLRLQIAALRYRASSNRKYLAECNPDDLVKSLNVRRFKADARADETRANALEARLRTRTGAPASGRRPLTVWPLVGAAVVIAPWVLLFAALYPR